MDFCLIVSVGTWQKGQFVMIEQKRSSRCARMQQENAMSDTPGVVKNLVRDTDPVE